MSPSGVVDMSLLAATAPLDLDAQQKYAAMGLPDPVAFAALTALGAIPDPMGMLNKMMLAAQERIDDDAASMDKENGSLNVPPPPEHDAPKAQSLAAQWANGSTAPSAVPEADGAGARQPHPLAPPPGKSFIEAFHELQKKEESQQQEAPARESRLVFGPIGGYAAQRGARGPGFEGETDVAEVEKLEERLTKQVKEAAEQAKMAANRAKEAAQTAAANRDASQTADTETPRGPTGRDIVPLKGFAQAFADDIVEEPQLPPARPAPKLGQTLSSLLTGRLSAHDGHGQLNGQSQCEKVCISNLPQNVTDSAIRLECARHGAVTSIMFEESSSTAYVSFASAEMAAVAVRRLTSRTGVFGAAKEPLQVRLISEIPDTVRLTRVPPAVPLEEIRDPNDLPEHLRPREERKKRRSRSHRRSRSRSRARRHRSRSQRRRQRSRSNWLDRSRSNSHTATGQYIRATGCSSTVRWWEKKRTSNSSSSRSKSSSNSSRRRHRPRRVEDDGSSQRPRQAAVKGNWAQFVQSGGPPYYYNLVTGQTTWDRPVDFDAGFSRRPWEVAVQASLPAARTGSSARATGALI